MEYVYLLTSQNKIVYEKLKKGEDHFARKETFFSRICPKTYNHAVELVNDNIKGEPVHTAVFSWQSVEGLSVKEIVENNKLIFDFIDIATELTGLGADDITMILKVPKDELVLTNFNIYADNLYREEFDEEICLDGFVVEESSTFDSIQALTKTIKPEWIVKAYKFEQMDDYEYKFKEI